MIKQVNLIDICDPKQWKTISSNDLHDEGYPVYGANGKIGYFSKYTHEFPTVLITCRGATCGTINICEPKSYVNGNAMALDNLDSSVDLTYLFYVLKYRGFDDAISGSAQPQITRQNLKNVKIPMPLLVNQRKIAAILDAADSLRQKDQQLVERYTALSQSLFLEMFGDPVTNQHGFEKGKIRDLISSANYGTSAKAQEGGMYPYLRMNNITYQGEMDFRSLKFINLVESDKPKYLVKKGDVLFNRTNSKELVGKTAIYNEKAEMAIAGYLIRLRVNERANPYFIWGCLNSKHGKTTLAHMCKSIVGMANINAQEVQNIESVLPPVSLQNQFAERIQLIEAQKQQAQLSLAKSEAVFNSLLQRAFTGELTAKMAA